MNSKRALVNTGLGIGIAAVGFGSWSIIGHTSAASAAAGTVVTAQTGNVLSSVTGTGNVITPTSLGVSFDPAVASNKLAAVLVKAGDKVTAGQTLAKVDDTTVAPALAQAQAQLAAAQASLAKAQNPVTADVLAQNNAAATQGSVAVANAQASVGNAQTSLANDTTTSNAALAQAQQSLSDAQAKAQQDLANEQTSVNQAQATLAADTAKLAPAQAATTAAATTVTTLTNDKALCAANATTVGYVPPDGTACAQVTSLLAAATQSATSAQTNFDSSQASVAKDTSSLQSVQGAQASLVLSTNQAITQANNAVTNAANSRTAKLAADQVAIDSAARQVTSAKASYEATLAGNAVKQAPPTPADLAAAQASVVSAQNAVATAQRNEDNTTLVAPTSGTIAATTAQVGVAASTGSSSSSSGTSSSSAAGLFTLTDLSALQVKVGFSESDAANVKLGQAATITFDSLPGVSLTGKVAQLDLTSTTVSNVVTYYAYVALDTSASLAQVKPGMTASVKVIVNHADNVVYLPSSALIARGTSATVNVEIGTNPNKTTPTPITLGLRGDTSTAVTSGLKAGDKIVIVRQRSPGGRSRSCRRPSDRT